MKLGSELDRLMIWWKIKSLEHEINFANSVIRNLLGMLRLEMGNTYKPISIRSLQRDGDRIEIIIAIDLPQDLLSVLENTHGLELLGQIPEIVPELNRLTKGLRRTVRRIYEVIRNFKERYAGFGFSSKFSIQFYELEIASRIREIFEEEREELQ